VTCQVLPSPSASHCGESGKLVKTGKVKMSFPWVGLDSGEVVSQSKLEFVMKEASLGLFLLISWEGQESIFLSSLQ
jgi:hypothetical protein